jgi:hypothetical protein
MLTSVFQADTCPSAWVLLSLLASPHFLYAFIWFRPQLWQQAFGDKAVDVFAAFGAVGKGEGGRGRAGVATLSPDRAHA